MKKNWKELFKLFLNVRKNPGNTPQIVENVYTSFLDEEKKNNYELKTMFEFLMKIKLFYEVPSLFHKWLSDPNILYTTKDMRKTDLYKKSNLNKEIEKLSRAFSNNRHCSSKTLDAKGPIVTNVSYYRKNLFEKWCKHMILLKDLGIKIINFN